MGCRAGRRGGVNAGHGQGAASGPRTRGGCGGRDWDRGAGREPEPPEPSDAGTPRRKGRGRHAQSAAAGHTRPVTRTRPVTLPVTPLQLRGNCPDAGLSSPHVPVSPSPNPAAEIAHPAAPAPAAPGGWNGHTAAPGPRSGTRTGGARGGYESAKRGRPLPAPPRLLRPGGPRGGLSGVRGAPAELPGNPAAVRPGAASRPPERSEPARVAPPPARRAWRRGAAPRDAVGAEWDATPLGRPRSGSPAAGAGEATAGKVPSVRGRGGSRRWAALPDTPRVWALPCVSPGAAGPWEAAPPHPLR